MDFKPFASVEIKNHFYLLFLSCLGEIMSMDWYLYMAPLYYIQALFTNTQVIILYALLSLLTLTLTFSILFDMQVCWDFATSLSINSHLAVLLSHSDNLMNLQHWSSHSFNVFHSVIV